MKYIITESQYNSLIRRLEIFRTTLEEVLIYNDPCEYRRIDQYKRVVMNELIGYVLGREQIQTPFNTIKQIDEFRDAVLYPMFEDRIVNYYNEFNEKC
jgi:hypothetical protein